MPVKFYSRAASTSKSGNSVNKNSILIQSVLNSLQNVRSFFILHYVHQSACSYNHRCNPQQQSLLLLWLLFISLFYLPTCSKNHPYHLHQHSPPLYLSHFSAPYFHTTISMIPNKKYFPLPQPIQTASKTQWAREFCEDWHCSNLSLLSQSLDKDSSIHNH